jgi:pyroglutamyl-peptidase
MSTYQSVLLTGFGPFPGIPVNASGLLATRLAAAGRAAFPKVSFATAQVPTEWTDGPRRARAAILRNTPTLIIHFGVSQRAKGFVIERQGVNACCAEPDGAGHMPLADCLDAVGPKARKATLPVVAIKRRLKAQGLPVALSDDAGEYLCNAVLFHSLAMAKSGDHGARVGFVHIPASLVGAGRDGLEPEPGCPLTWDTAIVGGLAIIQACLDEG